MRRAVILQGGGCKGAYSAGELAGKIDKGYTWDEYYGTSAGALVATIASLDDSELLRKAFTTMSNKDVWSKMPINEKGEIKKINALWKLKRHKNALGSTSNLRKTLPKLFTEEDFERLRQEDKEVIACSVNYSSGDIAYGRNDSLSYEQLLDAVWASTCVPILCEPVNINGQLYQDGGLLMNTPIQRAIDNGCEEIDIFMLNPKSEINEPEIIGQNIVEEWNGKGMIDFAGRSIDLMMKHISATNLNVATLKAKNKNVKLRFHYPEKPLLDKAIDAMLFDKKKMTQMFNDGYQNASKKSEKMYINQ